MKIGVHTFVWRDYFDDDTLPFIDKAKQIGYDSFEVVVGSEKFSTDLLKKRLRQNNIAVTMSNTVDPKRSVASSDKAVRKSARDFFRRCFDIAKEIGADRLVGPLHSNGQKVCPRPDKEKREEWLRVVDTLRYIAEDAKSLGITICIEPVNRYKNDLVNTVSEAIRMIDDIGGDNVKVLFDTYHANIEEKSLTDPIKRMGLKYLGEVHLCENDKGAPGSGHIDFRAIAETLRSIGYDEDIVFETFLPFNKDNIWRKLALSQEDLAKEALYNIREIFDIKKKTIV